MVLLVIIRLVAHGDLLLLDLPAPPHSTSTNLTGFSGNAQLRFRLEKAGIRYRKVYLLQNNGYYAGKEKVP